MQAHDESRHVPVLLEEVLAGLAVRPEGLYVDATFGRGGHSRAILARLGPEGRLVALDRDPQAILAQEARNLCADSRFMLVHAPFSRLAESLAGRDLACGILLDLGVSSPQLDDPERGFSFLRDGPLDMRMDTTSGVSAADWLAHAPEREIADVLSTLGEERFARRIARALVGERARQPIRTTHQLAELVARVQPFRDRHKHPATRTFQAVRMHINGELAELQAALAQSVALLAPGGRLVVVAFHSLEDRIVKRFMRDAERGAAPGFFPVPSTLRRVGRSIRPAESECAANPRARSAVLRVAERV